MRTRRTGSSRGRRKSRSRSRKSRRRGEGRSRKRRSSTYVCLGSDLLHACLAANREFQESKGGEQGMVRRGQEREGLQERTNVDFAWAKQVMS